MYKIKVNTDSINDAMSKLSGDTASLMASIAQVLVSSAEQSFEDERDPNTGQPWQSLSEAYAKKKAEGKYSLKLLQREGLLVTSIDSDSSEKEAIAGSNLVYAGTHQFGNENLNIPARPYLGIDDIAEEEILDAINEHYLKAFQ